MESAPKKQKISQLLAHQSSLSAWKAKLVLNNRDPQVPQSGAWKRQSQQILEPARRCYSELEVPAHDGGPNIRFWCANVEPLLDYVARSADFYLQRLGALEDKIHPVVVVEDEATGGNVLSTSSSKKMHLWYFTIQSLGDVGRADAWFPLACIPSRDVSLVSGSTSEVGAAVLRHLASQNLSMGVQVCNIRLRLEVKAFLGDYEAIRALLSAKGAAGLRPCALCKNILSKQHGTKVMNLDEYFLPISEDDPSKFDLLKADELIGMYRQSLREAAAHSKDQHKELETCLGFSLQNAGLLTCPTASAMVCVGNIMYDSLHQYFANGICSSEMIAFQELFQKATGFSLATLQESVREVAWVCRERSFRSPSSRSWLFNATYWRGDLYKGSASQTYFALPLLVHYANLLTNVEELPALESLNALYEAVLELKEWRRGRGDCARLDHAQRKHQRAFMRHYEGQERPKHHFRLHLPQQYACLGYADCWPCESRHKAYKACLADDMAGLFEARSGKSSKHILPRLLHRQAWNMQEHPWTNRLAGNIHSPQKVEEATGLKRVRVSNAFHLQQMLLQSDDIIFFDARAAWVHLFAEEQDTVFCILEPLQETASSTVFTRSFVRTDRRESINMKDLLTLRQPVWWHVDALAVLCLV